jgi:hypothetical protein
MNFEIAPKETEIRANWEEARMYCFALNIDGKVGWRLPTIKELNEIHESENDFENRWYWSSTEGNGSFAWSQNVSNGYQTNGSFAWSQNVSNGYQTNGTKSYDGHYVRAVRDLS